MIAAIAIATTADVIVALVTTTGVLFGALVKLILGIRRLRVENREQHNENRTSTAADMAALAAQLDMVHDDVKTSRVELRDDINRVHARINDHLRHHDAVPVVEPEHTTSSTAARPRKRKAS